MESDKTLGRSVNIFCCALVMVMFFVRLYMNGGLEHTHTYVCAIILVIEAIVLIFANAYREVYPTMIKTVIVLVYLSMCFMSLFVNHSNNLVYLLMMISTGLVALLFDKTMLAGYIIGCLFIGVISWRINIWYIANVFSFMDYICCMMGLAVEDIILVNLQRILFERMLDKVENSRTEDELLRVIDVKRQDALVATKSKSDFLASMSHEIRTPINAVLGLNEMILRECVDDNILEYSRDIRSASNSLLALVNDILDFSKIEAGKMEIHPVIYDLGSMLNDLINIIAMRAVEKGLSFGINVDPSLPQVLYGDEVRIKQIISNLLSNAVKYTETGDVELTVEYDKIDEYQIELKVKVRDTGHGMKEEDIAKLFAPFERIEEVRNLHVEGTGLGMNLTRNLLQMMGSDISVESVYGEGSVFYFTLRQEVENWECIGSLDEALKRIKNQNSECHNYFIAPEARVLVVDDMPMNLKVFISLLKRNKVQIDTANSGIEALNLVRKNKYNIIFLDHMMPEMDGIETLKKMKGDRFNINRYETPVIALTANAVSGARESYISEGFEDYMTKPIDSHMLESLMLKYLDNALITMVDDTYEEDESDNTGDSFITRLANIPGIDVDAGIKNAGGEGTYYEVVKEFALTVDTYSDRIEQYFNEYDIRNYTIQVHALKSSSRLLGALELSQLSLELEEAGNAGDDGFIADNTARLLEMYRGLKAPLNAALNEDAEDIDSKEVIDTDMFIEALSAIKEGIDSFDFDLIESVMQTLSGYKWPGNCENEFENMRVLMAQVDMEGMSNLINSIIEKVGA